GWPVASLGDVALASRGTTNRAGARRRMLAGDGGAVAAVQRARLAVVGASRARRLHGVGRTDRAVSGAELGAVTDPGRRPALGGGRCEAIRRARRARTVAALGNVAGAGGPAAYCAGVPRRMPADRARAVAHVAGTDVAVVGARGARRLARVDGTGGAGAGAGLGDITFAGRKPADRRGGKERAGRGAAGAAVALLSGIDDPVAAAAGAAVAPTDAALVERLAAVRQMVTAARRLSHGNA